MHPADLTAVVRLQWDLLGLGGCLRGEVCLGIGGGQIGLALLEVLALEACCWNF